MHYNLEVYTITNHLIEGSNKDTGRGIHNTDSVKFDIKIGIHEDTDTNWNLSKHTNFMHKN